MAKHRKSDPKRPKKQPKGDYAHGYAKIDPKHHWKSGQSGNPTGKRGPKRPPPDEDEIFLEEVARTANVKVGGTPQELEKLRISYRQLIDQSAQGDLPAIRETNRKIDRIMTRRLAKAAQTPVVTAELPLTEAELEVFGLGKKLEDVKREKGEL